MPEVARGVDDVADELFKGFGFWTGKREEGGLVVGFWNPAGNIGGWDLDRAGAGESERDCETGDRENHGIDEKDANLLASSARRLGRLHSPPHNRTNPISGKQKLTYQGSPPPSSGPIT